MVVTGNAIVAPMRAAIAKRWVSGRLSGRRLQGIAGLGSSQVPVRRLLADDTKGGPRDSRQALQADVFFAAQADSERPRIQAAERGMHFAQAAGVALQIAHRRI